VSRQIRVTTDSHDACHKSFTASRGLNQTIGRLVFLPALHSFSLWDLARNRTYHRHNNVRGRDYVWEPMASDEHRHCGRLRRTTFGLTRQQRPRQSRLNADQLRRQMAKLSAAAKLTHAR
jgi:fatty acid desaturase